MTSSASAVSSSTAIQWKKIEGAKASEPQLQAKITPERARSVFFVELSRDAELFADKEVTDHASIKSVLEAHSALEKTSAVTETTFLAYQKGERTGEAAYMRALATGIFVDSLKRDVQKKAGIITTNVTNSVLIQPGIAATFTARERLYFFHNVHLITLPELMELVTAHKGITQEEREAIVKNKDQILCYNLYVEPELRKIPTIDVNDLP